MQTLAQKYPCSSLVQMMHYVSKLSATDADFKKVSLYKNNPYLFVQYIKEDKAFNTKHFETITKVNKTDTNTEKTNTLN
jgi:hypothetical protein